MNQDTVTINKGEFEELQKQLWWLFCLEDAGLDNWQGIDFAREMFLEKYPEG